MTVIKYGDKIHILNGYNVWEGGYLDTNGHSTDGDTYNVSTNESATRDASLTGTWVLVCDSKHVGAEVISGDVIHVKNLYAAGTYLDSINHFPTKPGKYKVETATTSHRDGGSGTWQLQAKSSGRRRQGQVRGRRPVHQPVRGQRRLPGHLRELLSGIGCDVCRDHVLLQRPGGPTDCQLEDQTGVGSRRLLAAPLAQLILRTL